MQVKAITPTKTKTTKTQTVEKKHGPVPGKSEPKQPEVNIGMIGHVDHGKCIALDEPILLNNDLSDGHAVLNDKCGGLPFQTISENERLFEVPGLRAFSLDPAFQLVSVPARIFVQNYAGTMFEIITTDGKRLKASPEHPLLVHDGKSILWKKIKDLQKGDFVGALKEVPESPVVKDPFPQWRQELEKQFWVVSQERAQELGQKTDGFTQFDALPDSELNEIRIIKRLSFMDIQRACRGGHGYFSEAFKKGQLTAHQRKELTLFFAKTPTSLPDGFLLNSKNKSNCFSKVRESGFDESMLRFLAFIIAEGHVQKTSIRVAQSKNKLLSEFLEFCKQNFGVDAKYQGRFDYQLSSAPIVSFLQTRFGIRSGVAHQTGIPAWVFSLPRAKLTVFLRTFFSAEGNINEKSGQLTLIQANKKSIILLGYALKKFGITNSIHPIWKKATNSPNPKKREYWQLLISDRSSIQRFRESIGMDLPGKKSKLDALADKTRTGKSTNHMIPTDYQLVSELVGLLGLKKKHFSSKTKVLGKQAWFFAYQDCRSKNSISREKMNQMLCFFRKRYEAMPSILTGLPSKEFLSEWGVSQADLAQSGRLSPKQVFKTINGYAKKNKKEQSRQVTNAVQAIINQRKNRATILLRQLTENSPSGVEWSKIKKTEQVDYKGPIIDLQVPGYHNFVCGTGALISHNTSLTQALSGKWTDTHSEEIKRGISIRLGYADAIFFECPKCTGSERFGSKPVCTQCNSPARELRRVSFVDAPGHETLLATMLSGAAVMDGAILVVAANEPCPQPSTIEHVLSLTISGIKKLVVAQNKVDLVSKDDALKNHAQIKSFLNEHGFDDAVIIPTAAHFRLNVDLLIEAIQNHIPTPKKDASLPLRLFVVRSFDVNKPGTRPEELAGGVIGGSITQGQIVAGQTIEISPGLEKGPIQTIVTSLHTSFGTVSKAVPGGLIGLGTLLDPNQTKNDQMKGQIVAAPKSLPLPTVNLHLKLFPFKRFIGQNTFDFRVNETVVVTVGTGTGVGTIRKIAKDTIDILLKNPVTIEKNQKVAISKHQKSGWRLAAYGVCN